MTVPIVTGDFNTSPFLGAPDCAVKVGNRVVCHDGDPSVDDYWGVVIAVKSPRELHGVDSATRFPHGLVRVRIQEPVVERDWLGRPKDPEIERLRALNVDECDGCGPDGLTVRYCPIHGLHGTAPR